MALANTRGVTRWRRSAVIAVPATAAVAGMAAAMLNGVLAANISLTNAPFNLTADSVQTDDQGLGLNAQSIATAGGNKAAAVAGIGQAKLDKVCATASVGALGNLHISIPQTGTTANNLVLDATSLLADSATIGGDNTGNPIVLGQSSNAVGHGINDGNTNFGLISGNTSAATGSYSGGTGTVLGKLNASALGATIGGSLTVPGGGAGLAIKVDNSAGC